MLDATHKTCTRCQRTKDARTGFAKDPGTRDGRRTLCRDCVSVRDSQSYRTRGREYQLVKRYGISQAEYDALLAAQGGRCALCRTDEPRGRWGIFVVDHCHETGRVRGLLCSSCNSALGALGDSSDSLLRAYRYVAGKEID